MMTEETTTLPFNNPTAGALLRQYREAHGLELDALAHLLHVPVPKLAALEEDRLDDLPDNMFARALTLAVCRQLKTDAAAVLSLLPGQDTSRLAPKNERGIDSPLHRPSLLPQSNLLAVASYISPLRWIAAMLLLIAALIGLWPNIHGLLVFNNEEISHEAPITSEAVVVPTVQPVVTENVNSGGSMVVTTVHSAALAQQATSAPTSLPAIGASDAR